VAPSVLKEKQGKKTDHNNKKNATGDVKTVRTVLLNTGGGTSEKRIEKVIEEGNREVEPLILTPATWCLKNGKTEG